MSPSKLLSEVERGFGESQNQRDARVEQLWTKLDPGRTGELDLKGLQRGLKKIDHRTYYAFPPGSGRRKRPGRRPELGCRPRLTNLFLQL